MAAIANTVTKRAALFMIAALLGGAKNFSFLRGKQNPRRLAALPPSPTLRSFLTSLLSGFNLGRDQSHSVHYLCATGNVDHLGHVLELDVRVALDEHHALGTRLEDVSQPRLQITPGYVF